MAGFENGMKVAYRMKPGVSVGRFQEMLNVCFFFVFFFLLADDSELLFGFLPPPFWMSCLHCFVLQKPSEKLGKKGAVALGDGGEIVLMVFLDSHNKKGLKKVRGANGYILFHFLNLLFSSSLSPNFVGVKVSSGNTVGAIVDHICVKLKLPCREYCGIYSDERNEFLQG